MPSTRPTVSRKKKPKKKVTAAKRPTRTMTARRLDYGKPIEGTLARQPPQLRSIAEELREMIEAVAPEAKSSLKWGMPCFTIGRRTVATIGIHKEHVNLILWGPRGSYADPNGLLAGEGKMGAHLRLTSVDELPREAVRGWLRTAAALARKE